MKKINVILNSRIRAFKGDIGNRKCFNISIKDLVKSPIYDILADLLCDDTLISFEMFDYGDYVLYFLIDWNGVCVCKWQGTIYSDHYTKDLVSLW